MKTFIPFSILCALLFSACEKSDGDAADTELPAVTITSPTANQVVSAGQPVAIIAAINDNKSLYEVHLEIINASTGASVVHEHFVPDGAAYTLRRNFTPFSGTYRIKVEAEDKKRNKATAEVLITAN